MKNSKENANLNYIVEDQINAFENFRNNTNNQFKNLAPNNTNLGYNPKNNFQGAQKTPYFNILKTIIGGEVRYES